MTASLFPLRCFPFRSIWQQGPCWHHVSTSSASNFAATRLATRAAYIIATSHLRHLPLQYSTTTAAIKAAPSSPAIKASHSPHSSTPLPVLPGPCSTSYDTTDTEAFSQDREHGLEHAMKHGQEHELKHESRAPLPPPGRGILVVLRQLLGSGRSENSALANMDTPTIESIWMRCFFFITPL